MKRILLTMAVLASFGFFAKAQVTSITLEAVYTDDGSVTGYPANHTTYRIYANCTNATDRVTTVFGDAESPLVLNVGGSGIWNHQLGGVKGVNSNCNLINVQPIIGYDSYITFGYTCGSPGFNDFFIIEDDLQLWSAAAFNTVPSGGNEVFVNSTIGGAWVALPDHVNTEAGADLKILLGQITTDGEICGIFNLQVTPNYVNNNSPTVTQVGLSFGTNDCGTPGCTDPTALNYDETAGFNNGLCLLPCALTIEDVIVTNPTCFGDMDGSVEVVAAGNQGIASYSFNAGAYVPGNVILEDLGNGSVSISVKDLRFENEQANPGGMYGTCVVSDEVTVMTEELFIDAGISEDVSCGGNNDGCVNYPSYGGGTGDLSFALYQGNNPVLGADDQPIVVSSPDYCGLGGGTYKFIVTDANGCTTTSPNLVVDEPATFNLIEGFESAASCFNSADAIQVLSWGGGSGDVNFSFEDDGDYEIPGNASNVVLQDLMPGDYIIYAMDGNGCPDNLEFSVGGGPEITAEILVMNPSCPGAGDGSIMVMGSGGTGELMYSFDGANYSSENSQDGLAEFIYYAFVQDENICTAQFEIEVVDPMEISGSATATDITCFGLADGSILVSATGGTGMLLYSLDGVDFTPSPLFSDLAADNYAVYVEDSNGCSLAFDEVYTIAEPSAIVATATSSDVTCNGFGNGSIDMNVTGGQAPYLYSTGGAFSSIDPITGLEPNTYNVMVQDVNGCISEVTGIVISQPTAITINGLDANSIDEDAGGNTPYTVSGGTPNYSYEWVNAGGTVVSTSQNLPAYTSASDAGAYTLTITDANGCVVAETINITGVTNLNNAYSLSLYPNPSSGLFTLTLNGINGEKVVYTIMDESGRIVVAKEMSDVSGERVESIDLTSIASGIYIMNVTIGSSVETMRLIVQ
jgi:hypothetical protein